MFPLHTTVISRHPALATWIIIGLNAVVFIFELGLPSESLQRLLYLLGVVPARFTHPAWGLPIHEYWPFLTSMFLHGGWFHFISNMWVLSIFGSDVEDKMGPIRFSLFYLFTGVSSGAVHMLVNSGSTVPAIGASGAIAGVMGAYLVLFPRSRIVVMIPIIIFPFIFEMSAVLFLGFWFLLQLVGGVQALVVSQTASIAFWAHVGGFVAGVLVFFPFLRPSGERRPVHPDEGGIEHAWVPR